MNVDLALAYIEATLDNLADLLPSIPHENREVVLMLEDIRSLLVVGVPVPGTFTPDREICPQPCEHLSQHDAREGRTCPEHPCTCTDREVGGSDARP